MKLKDKLEIFLFFVEIFSFFFSGYYMAKENLLVGACAFGVGLIVAFIVGGSIYKRGEKKSAIC